jgi:protein-S-isoprenylcysteine O-methyltransferase Ste14
VVSWFATECAAHRRWLPRLQGLEACCPRETKRSKPEPATEQFIRVACRWRQGGAILSIPVQELLLVPAWGTFLLVWLVGSFRTNRTVRRSWGWDRLLLAFAVAIGLLALDNGAGRGASFLAARTWPSTVLTLTLGAILLYGGIALAIWARVHLGRYWSGLVTLKEGHRLIRSGPYAFVRNPIYTGLLVAVLGSAVVVGNAGLLLMFAIMLLTFLLKIRAEERLLREAFGAEYEAYAHDVKRLVPGVW